MEHRLHVAGNKQPTNEQKHQLAMPLRVKMIKVRLDNIQNDNVSARQNVGLIRQRVNSISINH